MATFGEKIKLIRDKRNLTQEELAQLLDTSKQVISRYEKNQRTPKITVAQKYADKLNVDLSYLIDDSMTIDDENILGLMPPPKTYKVPRLGVIACGQPILAEENVLDYDEVPENIHCNFTLKCKGDSMTGARINDGDIVYIRQQPDVENGEIAAVVVDEATEISEATLKRVYKYPEQLVLQAENPQYPPIVFRGEEINKVRIIGKAVGFTSIIEYSSLYKKQPTQLPDSKDSDNKPDETVVVWEAARSKDNDDPAGWVERPAEEIDKIFNAPDADVDF